MKKYGSQTVSEEGTQTGGSSFSDDDFSDDGLSDDGLSDDGLSDDGHLMMKIKWVVLSLVIKMNA